MVKEVKRTIGMARSMAANVTLRLLSSDAARITITAIIILGKMFYFRRNSPKHIFGVD